MSQWTILSLLNWTTEYFGKHQISNPRLDAEVLLSYLLKIPRIQLYVQFERLVSSEELAAFKSLIQRRVNHEPIAYLTGIKEFWSLSFKVGPGVLIPRPETEVLVDRGSQIVDRKSHLRILDIGTGCGIIAVSLAKELPLAWITAVEISDKAIHYAKENAEINKVSNQIEFVHNNFFTIDDPRSTNHAYDLVVSNPPYIPSHVIPTLDPTIHKFEPREALDGGVDGLDFYRKIAQSVPNLLSPKGIMALEIGEDQAKAVETILKSAGFSNVEVIKDYAGLDRVVIGYDPRSTICNPRENG